MANDFYDKYPSPVKLFYMYFYWIGQRFLLQKCIENYFCDKKEMILLQ